MKFDNMSFKGTFREYQQRVLDNSSKFLSDGKINIVAAPGSGKTILGLELIRRLNESCIIFSPTTTIPAITLCVCPKLTRAARNSL